MLILRLTAFALSAMQRLNSWSSSRQKSYPKRQTLTVRKHDSSVNSSMTQTNGFNSSNRYLPQMYGTDTTLLQVTDRKTGLICMYKTRDVYQQIDIIKLLRDRQPVDLVPHCLIDPKGTIQSTPTKNHL